MPEKVLEEALRIAIRDLRECYDESGILAGRHRLAEYWARDGMFASLGANALGDFEVVRNHLDLFLTFQREDGLIPLFISWKKKKPKYGLLGKNIDSNSLLIIAFADYIKYSRDTLFLERNYRKLSATMEWLNRRDKDRDGLIEEGLFENWQSTVIKSGKVLYSNCCYYCALKEYAWLSKKAGVTIVEQQYNKKAERTKHALNLNLWEGDYYYDWLGIGPKNFFDSAGNILAILFGVANVHRAHDIIDFIEKNRLNSVPIKTTEPQYPFWRINPLLLPFRTYYYHNGFSWPWLGCAYAMALNKIGEKKKAIEELTRVARFIERECVTDEVLDFEGNPMSSFLWKSERPFAWTAGLFVRAYDEIIGLPKKERKHKKK